MTNTTATVPAKQDDPANYKNVPIAPHGGGGMLMPQNFGEVVEFSRIMSRSDVAIPKYLRDNPGACMAITMQALRWELDPFLVASKSYSVKDLIAYEAQLVAAVVHTRAPLTTRPEYEYTGEGPDRRCKVSATFDDGVTRSYESPRVGDIAVKNSPLWKADTDQQLGYYSIRAFARRYCPEVILGVYTPEEAQEFRGPDRARDVTPRGEIVPLSQRIAEVDGAKDQATSQNPASNDAAESDIQTDAAPSAEGVASQGAELPLHGAPDSAPAPADQDAPNPPATISTPDEYLAHARSKIEEAKGPDTLQAWFMSSAEKKLREACGFPAEDLETLRAEMLARADELRKAKRKGAA